LCCRSVTGTIALLPSKRLGVREGKPKVANLKNAPTAIKTTKKTTRKVVTTTSIVVELGVKAQKAVADLVTLRDAIKQLEAQKKESEAVIREALGEAKVGFIKGVKRVELKDGKTTYFDRALLESDYPDAFTNTLRVTPYTKIVTM